MDNENRDTEKKKKKSVKGKKKERRKEKITEFLEEPRTSFFFLGLV
jgi:hypothetical protein